MSRSPEVSLIVTTYQRPAHLRRALASVARQQGVSGGFELVVADDGSTDETSDVVAQFARQAPFPVKFVTHRHEGFHAARVRNEGAAAAAAPYLVFLDGDCVIEPEHLQRHLRRRRTSAALFALPYILSQQVSERIDERAVAQASFRRWRPLRQRWDLAGRFAKASLYSAMGHAHLPRLRSTNFGLWRADYERVNGFDEDFRGWGGEDDDFGARLRSAGVRIRCAGASLGVYHLWHPRDPSANLQDAKANFARVRREGRPTRCRNGLVKRPPSGGAGGHDSRLVIQHA